MGIGMVWQETLSWFPIAILPWWVLAGPLVLPCVLQGTLGAVVMALGRVDGWDGSSSVTE